MPLSLDGELRQDDLDRLAPNREGRLHPASTAAVAAGLAVDIVVLNHDYGDYVEAAIESACAQTHPCVRVIVVDDGSTDGSPERLAQLGPGVDLVLKENGGQASAINAGLARCKGDIVIFLDADDVLKPHAAASAARAFAADPSLVRVQFKLDVIDRDGRPTGAIKPDGRLPMPSGDLRRAELRFPFDIPWLPTSANAFRRRALRRITPIPETSYPRCGADWYLVHLTNLLGAVASVDEVCGSYRVHGRNAYEPQGAELDMAHVRNAIAYAQATAIALAELADQLGCKRPERILSFSDLGNRLIARRLDGDPRVGSTSSLAVDAVRAVGRRSDVRWPMKAVLLSWFAATAIAPRPLVTPLAELFLFPVRRSAFSRLAGRLQRPAGAAR
jgi:Glycosyl transferase family 2